MNVYYPMSNLSVENAIVSASTLLSNTSEKIHLFALVSKMPSYKREILTSNNFKIIDVAPLLEKLSLKSLSHNYFVFLLPYLLDLKLQKNLVVNPKTIFYENVLKLFEKPSMFISASPALNFLQSGSALHKCFSDECEIFSSHLLALSSMTREEAHHALFELLIDTNYDSLTSTAWLNAMYFNRWTSLDFCWNVKTPDALFTSSFLSATPEQLQQIEKARQNPACISYYKLDPNMDKLSEEAYKKYQKVLKSLNF